MPLSRFNRDFRLVVQVSTGRAVEVVPPMKIAFEATKSIAGALNKMVIRVYNLKESNRLALVKDAERPGEQQPRIPIALSVGYKGSLQLLFKGTVHRGENSREGPDFITELECLDGGHAWLNGFTSATVKGKDRAIEAIRQGLPEIGRGKITKQNPITRPRVLVGSSGKLLNEVINDDETWYIDEEKLYLVKGDEVVSRFIPVVNAQTGLLNTPTREQSKVTFDTLMNPTLRIGSRCQLQSSSAPHLDGVYRIETIEYKGDNYGSDWSQSVTGFLAQGVKVVN